MDVSDENEHEGDDIVLYEDFGPADPPRFPSSTPNGLPRDVPTNTHPGLPLRISPSENLGRQTSCLPHEDSYSKSFVIALSSEWLAKSRIAVGDRIEHKSLDWGDTFPGSHTFFRTGNHPEEDVYILKPKKNATNENGKRLRESPQMATPARRPRTGPGSRRTRLASSSATPVELDDRTPPRQRSNESQRPPIKVDEEDSTRAAAPSRTPVPVGGITYRY